MCGNFGLLMLGSKALSKENETVKSMHQGRSMHGSEAARKKMDDMDISMHASMNEVSRLRGARVLGETNDTPSGGSAEISHGNRSMHGSKKKASTEEQYAAVPEPVVEAPEKEVLLAPVYILEAQTAATEIRGGQAGGFSSLEFKQPVATTTSVTDEDGQTSTVTSVTGFPTAVNARVRAVARKRYPLASDLRKLFLQQAGSQDKNSTVTVIGHTRFATSSVNIVSELHPHEWVPFHDEPVWLFHKKNAKFERLVTNVGIHITHNGDFDAMEAFSAVMVVDEVGMWLERLTHVRNDTRSDSSKIAGCFDFMRVQGRWGPAARLAWMRTIHTSCTDVTGGEQLSKQAKNVFQGATFWMEWGQFLESVWKLHINNIIKVIQPEKFDHSRQASYYIDTVAEKQLIHDMVNKLQVGGGIVPELTRILGAEDWSTKTATSFCTAAVRGFLRADLYNVLTELLSRAEGSFGVQVHCTIECGVVVIASKGQPMSLSFDPFRPVVLFGSEAEALAVPVDVGGHWQPERIDLDSHGEIIRIGEQRALIEGTFVHGGNNRDLMETMRSVIDDPEIVSRFGRMTAPRLPKPQPHSEAPNPATRLYSSAIYSMQLACGVELRSYSLVHSSEQNVADMINRCVRILIAPLPYDPKVDLVGADLSVTPAVLTTIDRVWANPSSVEHVSGRSLANSLVAAMKRRMLTSKDTTDLLIGGVEISMWVAEQWAADLRTIFPQLNVVTVSANKLLGLGSDSAGKVFFPGTDQILPRRIDKHTCVLLISQSGQTFATLHATRKLASLVPDRLWIMTGCFNSKMEQAMTEGFKEHGLIYGKNRVFNNYSGHRPAEPASVAVAATWHTLTRLLMMFINVTKEMCPNGAVVPDWKYEECANTLQSWARRCRIKFGRRPDGKRGQVVILTSKQREEVADQAAALPPRSSTSKGHSKAAPAEEATTHKLTTKGASVVMQLTDGCVSDMNALLDTAFIPEVINIVGFDQDGELVPTETNKQLVKRGRAWADHINEPWTVLCWACLYIIFSVGLGLPIFGLISDAIVAIIRAGGELNDGGVLSFAPRHYEYMYHQSPAWTIIGLIIQFGDAIWFVFLGKLITWAVRWFTGRPVWARHGKRTIVVVDTPCVHQLTENFVSKLYSQSYSFCSVDVHGASGLDHFVHRFTHRVVRGVLLAVGRPDGRICCLSKSESAVLLAAKQAAFIRNPAYPGASSGPEFVTIGHNPFEPNIGLAHNIVLRGTNTDTGESIGRRKFLDEYIYERLFSASKPFTASILRSLSRQVGKLEQQFAEIEGKSDPRSNTIRSKLKKELDLLPYGLHHVNPAMRKDNAISPFISECFLLVMSQKAAMAQMNSSDPKSKPAPVVCSDDPAVRLAFTAKLDSTTQNIQDRQVIVQQFYECRIASLERYIAWCVMFHAMARNSCNPLGRPGWDIARSQSNLRVATTASPISAGDSHGESISKEVKNLANTFALKLRGIHNNF